MAMKIYTKTGDKGEQIAVNHLRKKAAQKFLKAISGLNLMERWMN